MNIEHDHLRAKGWTKEEIRQTSKILERMKKHQQPHHKLLDQAIYLGVLALASFTTIGVATWVMPVFVYASASLLYPVLIVIALGFGLLFANIIKDLEYLTVQHHVILSALIPLVGIISFLIVVGQTNALAGSGGNTHNALLVGVIFTTFFITPYIHQINSK